MNGTMGVLLVLLFAVAVYSAIGMARRQAERELQVWRVLAERLGLRLTSTGDAFGVVSPRLEGKREGVNLVVETYTETDRDSDGSSSRRRFTRVIGRARTGLALKADVYAEHVFSGLGKLLGFQDVSTGDEAFDGAFVVKADDEERARRLLSPSARRAALALGDQIRVHYERGEITLLWPGFENKPAVLEELLTLVLALGTTPDDDESERDDEADGDDEDEQPGGDEAPPTVRKRNPRRDR